MGGGGAFSLSLIYKTIEAILKGQSVSIARKINRRRVNIADLGSPLQVDMLVDPKMDPGI